MLHHASGFGCDQGLKPDGCEQIGLGNLGFDQRCANGEDRLAGKNRRAFRDRKQIAGELQVSEKVEEFRRGALELRQRF